MEKKKAFLLLNGAIPKRLPELANYSFVCATDGAYNHFKNSSFQPDLVCGDFDSIESIPENITTQKTPDQNFTDFHKALEILYKKGFKNIDVFGASGKEQDHFLGNLSTAMEWFGKLDITFFDNYGRYFFLPKKYVSKFVLGKTISLIPFPYAENITSEGLEYPLLNTNLTFGKRIGTRNKALEDTIKITFSKGKLLVYISNN
ncbi:MAG: thiamine diphosphokinase [Flavicella sp.]